MCNSLFLEAALRKKCNQLSAQEKATETHLNRASPQSPLRALSNICGRARLLIYSRWSGHLWVPHQVARLPQENAWNTTVSSVFSNVGEQNNNPFTVFHFPLAVSASSSSFSCSALLFHCLHSSSFVVSTHLHLCLSELLYKLCCVFLCFPLNTTSISLLQHDTKA